MIVVPPALIGILALSDGGFDLPIRQQAALIVWWVLALALAFGVAPRSVPPTGWRLAAGGFLALAVLQLLSVTWGTSDDASIAEASRTLGYLGVVALAWCALDRGSWRLAADSLLAIAAGVTAYALLGRLFPDLAALDDFELSLGTDRLFAPLGYWNALAAWAAGTVGMALAWSAGRRASLIRAGALAMFPVAGVTLYLTYSRGGVVAGAVAVALVVGLSNDRRRVATHACVGALVTAAAILVVRSQPEIATGAGGEGGGMVALSLVAAMAVCWFCVRGLGRGAGSRGRPEPVRAAPGATVRLALGSVMVLTTGLMIVALVAGDDGFGRGGDSVARDLAVEQADPAVRLTTAAGNRSAYWSEALDGFAEQPLRGEGPGSFEYRWARFGSDPEQVADSHSLFFETATELGLLGLAALGLILGGLIAAGARGLAGSRRSGAAVGLAAAFAAFLLTAMIDWTWELPALAYLGLGSGAVLAMAASSPRRRSGARLKGSTRWALVGLALAAGAMQVPGIVATEFTRSSVEQRTLGFPVAAITYADDALAAAPWSASAYAARAGAELDAGDLDAAARDAAEAVRREPYESLHRLLLAEIAVEEGRLADAVGEIRRARRLSPLAVNRLGGPALELIGRIKRLRERQSEDRAAG